MATYEQQGATEPLPSAITVANVVYALHTLAIVVGVAGSATIVGSFVGSVPSIIAVILNYVKRGDARGTWLDSHYRWQIRTFWFALLWFVIAWVLIFTIVGIDHRLADPRRAHRLAHLPHRARLAAAARPAPDVRAVVPPSGARSARRVQ